MWTRLTRTSGHASPQLSPDQLPEATRETYQALFAENTKSIETIIAEQNGFEGNLAQVRAARIATLGNIPLIVLKHRHLDPIPPSANLTPEVLQQAEEVWGQLTTELAMLSPKGNQVVAEKSGHYILLEQPDLVIEAIKEVVADARK